MTFRSPMWLTLPIALTVALGCGEAPEPEAAPTPSVTSIPALDLALSGLPAPWLVLVEGEQASIAPDDPEASASITVAMADPELGENLVAAVTAHQEAVESTEGGRYFGAQELSTPLGTAFYSRGQRPGPSGAVGEIAVFVLHPRRSGIVSITTTYPAEADPAARIQEALAVLEAIE